MNSFYFFQGMGFFRLKSKLVYPPSFLPQTVLKVSARVEKYVPHYWSNNEFSILTGGTFTFKTVSPENAFHRRAPLSTREFW